MTNIAIIGFGVVGGGITSVIEKNMQPLADYCGDELYVKYILDLREFPDSPYADRVVHDISYILEDDSVKIVCETMGGVNPAFDFSMKCLSKGKSVVTSNKELVAKKGIELVECAKKNGVQYLFEAAVGGGIPEITSMRTSFGGDKISKIDGIVNGTTNYILTKIKNEGVDYETTIIEAQKLGYAERNPSADVDGFDAQRKIMILTAVATNNLVDEKDVYCETMTKISPKDMEAAEKWGGTVKMVASSRIYENNAALYVTPVFVSYQSPISHVDDVYNAIKVASDTTGDIMYYGRGAGRMPTAGAVVADVAQIASGVAEKSKKSLWKTAPDGYVIPYEDLEFSYYVRLAKNDIDKLSVAQKISENEVITNKVVVKEFMKLINSIDSVESVIRILD